MKEVVKKETIFNRNHITIEKYTNNVSSYGNFVKRVRPFSSCIKPRILMQWHEEKVKKHSKLGFDYMSTVRVVDVPAQKGEYVTSKTFKVCVGKSMYVITYIEENGETNLSVDTRPWEIMGDKPLSDDQYKLLYDTVKLIIEECKANKIRFMYEDIAGLSEPRQLGIDLFYKEINKDMFGSEKGYEMMSNKDRIIANGFDLKTSFRK